MKGYRCPHCHHGFELAAKPKLASKCPRCGKPGARAFQFPVIKDQDKQADAESCEAPGVFAAQGSLIAALKKA